MFTSQPLSQDLAVAHKDALLSELSDMSLVEARDWFARNILGGGRCTMSRKAIVLSANAFMDRLIVSFYQCQF